MIKSISIKNIALIENLKVDFYKDLNIITGETGTGKSILLNAIGLILGEKFSSHIIRTGEHKASVEVVFDISNNSQLKKLLDESGLEIEDNTLIIKREITEDSKSRSFINLNSVPNSNLKTFGEYLLDISSQHEHQSLLRPHNHIDLLDNYSDLQEMLSSFTINFNELKELNSQLEEITSNEKEKNRIFEVNRFAIEEIESVNLQNNEDLELEKELEVLNNFEKLNMALNNAYNNVYLQDNSIIPTIEHTISELEKVIQFDSKIEKSCNDLREGLYIIENVRDVLRSYKDSLDFSPDRIEEINQRLKIINDLKRKYGSTIADVIMHKTKCEKENEKYSQNLDLIEKLTDKIKQLEKESSDKVISLSKVRQKKAKDLEKQIEEELAFLGMDKATFRVEFRYVQDDNSYLKITDKGVKINEKGIDRVEFTFSANPGEIPRPLAKIASGGELSRVMLAMKTILTDMDEIETLLFDEVDAGIGGEIAVKVAKKIKSISNKRQVICITHSPQIASLSEHHYLVEKVFENNRTKTTITKLTDEEKVKDIARMLGGEKITEVSIQHARELIANK